MNSRRYTRQAVAERRRRRDEQLRRELDRLVHLLASRPDVHTAILFGSVARGDSGEHSDLDLTVVMDSPDPFLERVGKLYEFLEPRVALDLFAYTPEEWARLKDERRFAREIAKEGKVLFEAVTGQ